jgi:DNA-binding NtrC family response regulator
MSSRAVVIANDPGECTGIQRALADIACDCRQAPVGAAVEALARHRPDVVILVTGDNPQPALDCLQGLHQAFCHLRFLMLATVSSEDLAIAALRCGAHQYVRGPWTPPTLQAAVADLLPSESTIAPASDGLAGGEQLVGRSRALRELRQRIARLAPASSNVLILGETGTGKELIAELIHRNGARADRPLVCINTAAIPDALLENELFGHERGAFTGAIAAQGGKLAAAHGGTLFLDEIGEVSLAVQAKLLRAIENKSIYRLGGTRPVQFDARIVAATNSDLEQAAHDGRFRKDLYYRLNVVRVEVPPLRERVDDIPLLIGHYLLRFNRELGRSVRGLSARALDTLCRYHWPGNVRELRNVVEALLVNLAPETSGIVDVPPDVMRQLAIAVGAPITERERLLNALTATNWNKSRAARELHWSRMTLYRKMQRHDVAMKP